LSSREPSAIDQPEYPQEEQRKIPKSPKKSKERYQNSVPGSFTHKSKEISRMKLLNLTLATLVGSAAAFAPSKMASSSTSLHVVSLPSRAHFVPSKIRLDRLIRSETTIGVF
jgi:hypothetical protein